MISGSRSTLNDNIGLLCSASRLASLLVTYKLQVYTVRKISNLAVNKDHKNKKLGNKDGHLHLQIF